MKLLLVAEKQARSPYAAMIKKAAETAAPLIEEITGLTLPDEVTIRLTFRLAFAFDVINA